METNWNIAGIKSLSSNGLVIKATYTFNAEQDNILDRKVGELTFTGQTSDPGFVPFNELTENIVLGWVFNKLGAQKTEIENEVTGRVTQRLVEIQNNPYTNEVPWNKQNL